MSDLKNEISELSPSELGTKEYWENNYEREIKNYQSHGDVGEVWFDEDSQERIVNWILKTDSISLQDKIIDLGCGNGMFLISLAREGYKNLLGVDYSPKGIDLAKGIAKDQELLIDYKVVDLLNSDTIENLGEYDVVHDKGTYDAVSLHPENTKEKREMYIKNVKKLLSADGFFVITSCNWTDDELEKSFAGEFKTFYAIPTPTFKFGGKVGSVVTSLVFKKI